MPTPARKATTTCQTTPEAMQIVNHTDIPAETLRAIVRVVRPPGITGFDVRVSNMDGNGSSWPGRGRAYVEGSGYHRNERRFVVVSLGARKHFPRPPQKMRPGRGYLDIPWLASREESAAYFLAHELRHLWQQKVPKGRRVWGARGRYSERGCGRLRAAQAARMAAHRCASSACGPGPGRHCAGAGRHAAASAPAGEACAEPRGAEGGQPASAPGRVAHQAEARTNGAEEN